ncbi:transcriptional regulator [Streptomyces sp. CFMR 7]|uniref:transcriptional regulator n=1 Tax=Streptomyces sp. CFMR 7 TaxID=1649184 RepID=UPI0006AD16E9|nr:transcriptional regulator [Streptomyces sp. CFMR 7]ALC28502.1 regulatory protein MerR [Streptomyces sp. CFMR 7]
MTTSRRRTVSTELAALAMGVSEATIRKWASRGKITRYGRKQRAEYDLDELLALTEGGAPLPVGRSGVVELAKGSGAGRGALRDRC